MLAGDGIEFLYTAISSCKAAFHKKWRHPLAMLEETQLAIPISRRTSTWLMDVWIGALSALSLFWRESAALLTGALESS
jgi:hypothetical protein